MRFFYSKMISHISPLWASYTIWIVRLNYPTSMQWVAKQGQNGPMLELTHWGQDKMVAISQMTITNAINISLKFVSKGQIYNIPSLVQIMAWRWPGDKPLSEPMMVSLLKHTCITRPQWVKLIMPYLQGIMTREPACYILQNLISLTCITSVQNAWINWK